MTEEGITYWHDGMHCCNPRWEEAYERFESPEEERAKFRQRFVKMGFRNFDRSLRVIDLFCGRGNALRVLQDMGFQNLTGVDLSPSLLQQAPSSASRVVADCTELRFEPESVDVFVVQGGLHHLPNLAANLPLCLDGITGALAVSGLFCFVEPWETPFLRAVHWVSTQRCVRKRSKKIDAFATMVEEEYETYRAWLSEGKFIRSEILSRFTPGLDKVAWGKWMFVGEKKSDARA